MNDLQLRVPGITCDHCVRAISAGVSDVPGVTAVRVDVETKSVRVHGDAHPEAVRAAIQDAGYDPQP